MTALLTAGWVVAAIGAAAGAWLAVLGSGRQWGFATGRTWWAPQSPFAVYMAAVAAVLAVALVLGIRSYLQTNRVPRPPLLPAIWWVGAIPIVFGEYVYRKALWRGMRLWPGGWAENLCSPQERLVAGNLGCDQSIWHEASQQAEAVAVAAAFVAVAAAMGATLLLLRWAKPPPDPVPE